MDWVGKVFRLLLPRLFARLSSCPANIFVCTVILGCARARLGFMCRGSNFWVDFIAPVAVIGVDVDFKAFNGLASLFLLG